MKKAVSILCVVLLCISLTACSPKEEETMESESYETTESTTEETKAITTETTVGTTIEITTEQLQAVIDDAVAKALEKEKEREKDDAKKAEQERLEKIRKTTPFVTKANADKIKVGMTRKEVVAILGEGEVVTDTKTPTGERAEKYYWYVEDTDSILAVILLEEVVTKVSP